jgi:hypothetical protein
LISKDRYDDAFEILTKYHAEGDRNSVIVKAELAQIDRTIKLELEESKQSWWDMFRTAGMRRRLFISAFLGLFTQWSGNTLITYAFVRWHLPYMLFWPSLILVLGTI